MVFMSLVYPFTFSVHLDINNIRIPSYLVSVSFRPDFSLIFHLSHLLYASFNTIFYRTLSDSRF